MSILNLPHAVPRVLLFDWHATLVDTHDAMYYAVNDVLPKQGPKGSEPFFGTTSAAATYAAGKCCFNLALEAFRSGRHALARCITHGFELLPSHALFDHASIPGSPLYRIAAQRQPLGVRSDRVITQADGIVAITGPPIS